MSRWIRRALLCIALGFATAWLVAWGLTVGMWAGWYQPWWARHAKGVGVVEPWLLEKEVNRYPGWETESWNGDRLDGANQVSEHHRRRADRVLEIGGADFAEEREREMLAFLPQLEEMVNEPAGSMTEQYLDATANSPPSQRIDDQIASFPPAYLTGRMAAMEADNFFLYATRVGWPMPMLESIVGHEHTFAASGLQKTDVEEGQIKIDALKRAPVPGWPPQALSMPFGVIAQAAVTNTLFFAASWFASSRVSSFCALSAAAWLAGACDATTTSGGSLARPAPSVVERRSSSTRKYARHPLRIIAGSPVAGVRGGTPRGRRSSRSGPRCPGRPGCPRPSSSPR